VVVVVGTVARSCCPAYGLGGESNPAQPG